MTDSRTHAFEAAVRAADAVLASSTNPDTGKPWHPGDTHPTPQHWHRAALQRANDAFKAHANA